MDRTLAAAGLVMLAPVIGAVALGVKRKLGSPIFFRQERLGYEERPFHVVKFRTMRDARDSAGNPLPDQERITPFGTFLRKTSLDELPQLWNVLRGDMSLIGPRPLFVRYLPHYTERERRRHSVRPGITGLAQVTGRNTMPWDDRLELDVQYVERQSLRLDASILLHTLLKVVRRDDIVVVPGETLRPLDRYRTEHNDPAPLNVAVPAN